VQYAVRQLVTTCSFCQREAPYPVRSSHSHFVKASGLRWLSLMLTVRIPWAERVWERPEGPNPSRHYCSRGRRRCFTDSCFSRARAPVLRPRSRARPRRKPRPFHGRRSRCRRLARGCYVW